MLVGLFLAFFLLAKQMIKGHFKKKNLLLLLFKIYNGKGIPSECRE